MAIDGQPRRTARRVRQADPDALPTLLGLAVAFYAEGGFSTPIWMLRKNLSVLLYSDDARIAIASARGDIVGFAITTLGFGLEYGLLAEIEDLYVRPTHRRTGTATALVEDSAEWARSRGCSALEVVVAPNGNDVAHLFDFYARRGFTDGSRKLLKRDLRSE